mmetsp:Transcript_16524/g.46116  ORF Transcript_16524/g.46116 Transcript_16524/m.46116 type:complete len:260 (+) Transcript_16524:271-1050(+)
MQMPSNGWRRAKASRGIWIHSNLFCRGHCPCGRGESHLKSTRCHPLLAKPPVSPSRCYRSSNSGQWIPGRELCGYRALNRSNTTLYTGEPRLCRAKSQPAFHGYERLEQQGTVATQRLTASVARQRLHRGPLPRFHRLHHRPPPLALPLPLPRLLSQTQAAAAQLQQAFLWPPLPLPPILFLLPAPSDIIQLQAAAHNVLANRWLTRCCQLCHALRQGSPPPAPPFALRMSPPASRQQLKRFLSKRTTLRLTLGESICP